MIKHSIVLPTKNRFKYFKQAIKNLREDDKGFEDKKEIIVIYSENDKETKEWVLSQEDIVSISENEIRNNYTLYNIGLKKAFGEYISFWGDDLDIELGAFRKGIEYLDNHSEAAAVVFRYSGGVGGGYRFARQIHRNRVRWFFNFGVMRASIVKECGYCDDIAYKGYWAVPEMCVKIYEMGLDIVPLDYKVTHYNLQDQVKERLQSTWNQDKAVFTKRWGHIASRDVRDTIGIE